MPRNPKVVALMRADIAESNYRAAERALAQANKARKKAMVACVEAGCTLYETGQRFNTTGSYVGNVRAELAREAELASLRD